MSHRTKRNHLLGGVTLLVAIASLAATTPGARAQTAGDVVDLAGYRIITTVTNPDGTEFTRTTPALVAVPQLVNADRSLLSLPDFTVVVIPLPGAISMQVVKLSTAALPAKVELIFDLPGAGEKKLSVGYDTLSSGARSPLGFGATATFNLGSPLVVDARTSMVHPGASLAILGSLFEETAGIPRANPKTARIEYTPVPENGRLRLRLEDLEQERTIDVRAETDRRVKAVIDASDVSPGAEQRLSTTVVGMPTELDVGLDLPKDKDNGRLDFNYAANERAESIDAHGTKLTNGAIELDVLTKVTDMSRKLDVVKEGTSRVTIDANAAIDQIDVAFAKGAEAKYAPASAVPTGMRHFALLTDTDDPDSGAKNGIESAAARVRGLRHAEFQLEKPLIVDVELSPGPLFVRATRGPEPIEATVRDIPAQARIELAESRVRAPSVADLLTLNYTGTGADGQPATIGEIVADVTEPDGFPSALERATKIHALVKGLPSGVSFSSRASANRDTRHIELGAGGKTIDLAEVTVSDGGELPEADVLPSTHDGLVFRDVAERFHVFGRITGLRGFTYQEKPRDDETGEVDVKEALLDAVGDPDAGQPADRRRPVHVDVRRAVENSTEFVIVDLANLVPQTTLRLARFPATLVNGDGVTLRHTAPFRLASAEDDLRFRTNFGPVELVSGSLDPLPAGPTEMCFAKSAKCIGSKVDRCYQSEFEEVCVGSEGTISAGFRAFEPVSAKLFVCEDRLEGGICSPDDDRATFNELDLSSIENLQFKFLSQKGEGEGHAFINTDDPNNGGEEKLTGVIRRHEPNVIFDGNVDLDLDLKFSDVFNATDRFVRFDGANANISKPKLGFVECGEPGTTELKVIMTGFAFDLGDRICKD